MGHALGEIRSSLVDGGTLVDLRPVSSRCPLELVTRDGAVRIAEIEAFGMQADDDASDAAARAAVEEGLFRLRHRTEFRFDYYWDGLDEMEAYVVDSRRMTEVRPTIRELRASHRELDGGATAARLRCRRTMMLAVYEKAAE